ncbi:MAG TPA: biotin/lipoyl-containing protein, partial [Gemmatimonadales bacterium]
MATKVFMEALSPTMEEGRLVKWLKNEGDQVASGDVLAEVETDKAIMELVARGDGVLRKRLIGEGDTSPVGNVIGVIAAPDEDIASIVGEAGGAGGGAGAAAGAEGGAEGGAGAPPQQQDNAGAAAPADRSAAAVIAQTREQAGASPVPESPYQSRGEASTPPQEKIADAPAGAPGAGMPAPTSGEGDGRLRSSPLARRLASERGLDLAGIQGSGPGGRIIRRDV